MEQRLYQSQPLTKNNSVHQILENEIIGVIM